MAKLRLKWLSSYETLKFDTIDGDLDINQFARVKGGFYIRTTPKNNSQFTFTTDVELIQGKQEVGILEGENCYYHQFELPDGRLFRELCTRSDYLSLGTTSTTSIQPIKEVTDREIIDITKDDILWR